MKTITKVCHYLLYLVSLFFVVMALDMFDAQYLWWEQIVGFLISSLPGIGLALLNYLLRKHEMILGFLLIAASIFFLFFFKLHIDIAEKILTILTVPTPILICGIIFIISRNQFD